MPAETTDGPDPHPMTEKLATAANVASVATVLPSGRTPNPTIWVHAQDGRPNGVAD